MATLGRDAQATVGLADAYAALEPDDRLRLIEAVVADAAAEKVSPGPALLALLSVETRPAVAAALAAALGRSEPGALAPRSERQAGAGGDPESGTAILARPLHGDFLEALTLRWEPGGSVTACYDPLVHAVDLDARLAAYPTRSFAKAIDVVAAALWRRRGAELPPEAARFADLFTP